MAIYKTTKALSTRGRIIPKGGRVPSSHPRFHEGIKNGWIVKEGNGAVKSAPPVSPSEKAKSSITEPPLEAITDTEEVETTEPDSDGLAEDSDSPTIDELEFLNRMDEAALLEQEIMQVSDLKDWTAERLEAIRGIGPTKAAQLIETYDEWANSENAE